MLTNVVANYVLIFGKFGVPAMGIAGAAYGTVLGSVCGLAVVAAGYLARANRTEFGIARALRYDAAAMGKLLRFGYPAGVEFFLNLLAFNILILSFHSRGIEAATAVTIVFNWDMVSFIPLIGVNIGVTSLVGRYMGAGSPDTAHRATMSGLRMAWLYACCTLVAFSCFPEALVSVFRPADNAAVFEQAYPMAVHMLRLASLYVLADATILVFSGALRGAGDTFWAMVISVGMHWALVAIQLVMLKGFDVPVETAWLGLCLFIMAFSAIFYTRYRSGRWRLIRVVQPDEEPPPPATDGLHETADL